MNERPLATEVVLAVEHETPGPDGPGRGSASWLASELGVPMRAVHVDPSVADVVTAIIAELGDGSILVMHSEHANQWSGKRSVTEHVVDQWGGLTCIEGPESVPISSGPVLVAVDGSDDAVRALVAARQLAQLMGSKVSIARVTPDPFDDRDDAAFDAARSYLAGVALDDEEVVVARSNLVVDALCAAAAERDCSVIVLASRGDRSTPRATMSRTCSGLVAGAVQPVVIVGPRGG